MGISSGIGCIMVLRWVSFGLKNGFVEICLWEYSQSPLDVIDKLAL